MGEQDFREWYADFRARFPSKAAWAEKSEGTLAKWLEVMADVELRDAIAANMDLHRRGALADRWDDIPAEIRREARRCRGQRILDQNDRTKPQRPKCAVCGGDGWVVCWHSGVSKSIALGRPLRNPFRSHPTVSIACACRRGVNNAQMPSKRGHEWTTRELPQYDPNQFCRVVRDRDPHSDVVEWIDGRVPAGHHTEFDEF